MPYGIYWVWLFNKFCWKQKLLSYFSPQQLYEIGLKTVFTVHEPAQSCDCAFCRFILASSTSKQVTNKYIVQVEKTKKTAFTKDDTKKLKAEFHCDPHVWTIINNSIVDCPLQ